MGRGRFELVPLADDFTLMSPFGGTPTRASAMTDERWEAIGRYFRNGTFKQDVVQSYYAVLQGRTSAEQFLADAKKRLKASVNDLLLEALHLR